MKNHTSILRGAILAIALVGCQEKKQQFDASGTFEATEIIVSAEATGRILDLKINEGDSVAAGKILGKIDPLSIELQKEQVAASVAAVGEKQNDAAPQIGVLTEQITAQRSQIAVLKQQSAVLQKEQQRIASLVNLKSAPPKQLDDINGQMEILQKQIAAAESSIAVFDRQIAAQRAVVGIQNRGLLSEKAPLQKRMKQLDDQIARTQITNPINGVILSKYAEVGEITTVGKAIYKVANLSELTLRAYITGGQLPQVRIGQTVKIFIDNGAKDYREVAGVVSWISDKAEFTPKTIQTKDERANLVYAIKVKAKNDGTLKIGMYGEVKF